MKSLKLLASIVLVIIMGIMGIIVVVGQDTDVDTSQEETGEVFAVTNASGYREYFAPDLGTFEYPIAFYSVYQAEIYPVRNTSPDILFPGVITIIPNDSVIYGVQFDTAYRISMAAIITKAELDVALLGTGPLLQYEADMFDADAVQEITVGGIEALRIDNLNVGPFENVTDIIVVHQNMLIELLIDPIAEVNGTAIDGKEMLNGILNSFAFLD